MRGGAEIVVVDNANLASTQALVAAYPNARYIAAPENLGFAGGNNLGLPLCTRPSILDALRTKSSPEIVVKTARGDELRRAAANQVCCADDHGECHLPRICAKRPILRHETAPDARRTKTFWRHPIAIGAKICDNISHPPATTLSMRRKAGVTRP